jgi:hypothetical protein
MRRGRTQVRRVPKTTGAFLTHFPRKDKQTQVQPLTVQGLSRDPRIAGARIDSGAADPAGTGERWQRDGARTRETDWSTGSLQNRLFDSEGSVPRCDSSLGARGQGKQEPAAH